MEASSGPGIYPGFQAAFDRLRLTAADGAMLAAFANHKGRQDLFLRRRPQALEALCTVALVESSESSNRLEGMDVPRVRVAVPEAMGMFMDDIRGALDRQSSDELLWIPLALIDSLCIHPFRDGNGRVARLLTLLLLYSTDWVLGRYISLERLVEEAREDYYSLEAASQGWHEQLHDPLPWCRYVWGVLLRGYREFKQQIDALAEMRKPEELTIPRAEKRELVREACLRQLLPFAVGQVEWHCPGVSRELIRQVLLQLAVEGRVELRGKGRAALWHPLSL